MKNWERFSNRREALEAHKAEGVVFGCGWGEIEWLYMDYVPNEPRIDYLCRLRKRGILKSNGFKELERLKKAAPHPDPLTPEEELADTITRQKELDV